MAKCQHCGLIFVREIPPQKKISEQRESDTISYYSNLYSGIPKKFFYGLNLIEHYLKKIGINDLSGISLLDIGCGNGSFLNLCRERGFKVAGVDINPYAVKLCRKRGISSVFHGSIDEVSGYFDIITMFDLLEHLVDPLSFMRKVWRKLKPGGIIFIETPRRCLLDTYISLLSIFTSIRSNRVTREHLQLYTDKSLRILLEEIGYTIVYFLRRQSLSWSNKTQYLYNMGLRNKILLSLFTSLANLIISLNLLGRNKAIILAVKERNRQ